MYKLNPFFKWFWSLFTPTYIHGAVAAGSAAAAPATGGLSLLAPFAIDFGSKLFGSLFGGGGAPKIPPEAQFARSVLAAFAGGQTESPTAALEGAGGLLGKLGAKGKRINEAAQGLFPEEDILQKAFGSITSRINRQKEGATARAASLGIKPGSGLAENLRSGIQRGEAEAFGKTRSSVSIAKANARRSALFALLGLPSIPQGIDAPNVIAQGGQDLSQLLLLKDFLKS